jgi:hypothetical protein
MTSSVIVLGVFVLLVAPTGDLLASLSALLHPTLILQKKKIQEAYRTGRLYRVSDPYSFGTDPDPAFKAEYRSGSGSRVFTTKNYKKFTAENKRKICFDQKLLFAYP